jgi:hypothetical protein
VCALLNLARHAVSTERHHLAFSLRRGFGGWLARYCEQKMYHSNLQVMVVLRVRKCIAVEISLIPVAVASENAETRMMGKRKLPNSTHNCPSIGTLYVMLKDRHQCEDRV